MGCVVGRRRCALSQDLLHNSGRDGLVAHPQHKAPQVAVLCGAWASCAGHAGLDGCILLKPWRHRHSSPVKTSRQVARTNWISTVAEQCLGRNRGFSLITWPVDLLSVAISFRTVAGSLTLWWCTSTWRHAQDGRRMGGEGGWVKTGGRYAGPVVHNPSYRGAGHNGNVDVKDHDLCADQARHRRRRRGVAEHLADAVRQGLKEAA